MTPNGFTESDQVRGDRRKNRRYALSLPVRYKVKRGKRLVEMGRGQTLDMSSSGIRFATAHLFPERATAELWVEWPVALNDRELRLVVHGRVVRSDGKTAAVRMIRREFRVAARRAGGQENRQGEVRDIGAGAE